MEGAATRPARSGLPGGGDSGEDIPDPPTRPDLAQSIFHPVISPSGMAVQRRRERPGLGGNLLIGGLPSTDLVRGGSHPRRRRGPRLRALDC
jgi:hypothetical protein